MQLRLSVIVTALYLMTLAGTRAEETLAKFTQVHGKVDILAKEGKQEPRTAKVGGGFGYQEMARSQLNAKAEMEMSDKTLIRMGSNTVFSFNLENREFSMTQGEALFVFPKSGVGSKIRTAALTAGITGTTVYVKATSSEFVYACLEGTCKIGPHAMKPGDKLVIRTGQNAYSAPVQKFIISGFMKNNILIKDFTGALPSKTLIDKEIQKQSAQP